MSRFLLIVVLIAQLAGIEIASAHTGFENETEVRIFADRMEIYVRATSAFAWKILGERAPMEMDGASQAAALPLLTDDAQGLFDVTAAGSMMKPVKVDCTFELDQHVAFLLTFKRPPGWPLVLTARFFDFFDPLSSGTIKVFDQTTAPYRRDIEPLAGKILFRGDPSLSVSLGPPSITSPPRMEPLSPGFGRYFLLGVEHIVTGYDHLLFLLALLLGCRSLRLMLIVVTAFTVAHSVTLALAAFGVVDIPARWVESFIALSIIYVGVENIGCKVVDKRRAWLTFAFGLVHGLGFASVLRGIGIGAGGLSILPPLLAFNLGVEAGQLLVVVIVLPVLIFLRKKTFFACYGVPVLSGVVIVAGAIWFLQRVFGVV